MDDKEIVEDLKFQFIKNDLYSVSFDRHEKNLGHQHATSVHMP